MFLVPTSINNCMTVDYKKGKGSVQKIRRKGTSNPSISRVYEKTKVQKHENQTTAHCVSTACHNVKI